MTRSRVLYISNAHPELYIGGAEVYSYELYRQMQRSPDFEPVLLARSVAGAHARTRKTPFRGLDDDPNQVLWFQHRHDYFFLSSPDKEEYTVHFHRFLKAYRPDVVHIQHTIGLGYDLVRQVRNTLPDAPIVFTLHEFLPICNAQGLMIRPGSGELCQRASPLRCHECFPDIPAYRHFLRERFIKSHLALVDLFLVPSHCLIDRFRAWGLPEDKLCFQEYGRLVQPPVAADGPPPDRRTFGFFGQLRRHKGILVLLEAMRRLVDAGERDLHLVVNGANLEHEPEEVQKGVRELIRSCRGQVTFAGRYTTDEIPVRMRDIAWAVVPSTWWENSPLVIQEAFMHRRPVICSNIGGMAEKVRDGVDGLHFRVGDPADLARTLRRAAQDEDLWSRLQQGIRPVFSMADAASELATIYRDLLGRARSQGDNP